MSKMITVFTPTYNRGYIIMELYQSLMQQTSYDFEWLVIDDGSTDDTDKCFSKLLKKEQPFPIRYIKKKNGGKHRAINDGVKQAKGKLFFIVDSDDQLTHDAIEKILKGYAGIAGLKGYAGIAGLRGYDLSNMIGTTFQGEWIDATCLERQKYQITGDKAEVFYTEVLRKHPFPEFDGENFVTEAIVWNRIAETGLKLRWFNEIIYLCEYHEDGLTNNLDNINKRNPRGYALNMTENIRFGNYTKRDIMNIYYHYYTVVSENVTISQCAQYLHIPVWLMGYIVLRCKTRDRIRRICR